MPRTRFLREKNRNKCLRFQFRYNKIAVVVVYYINIYNLVHTSNACILIPEILLSNRKNPFEDATGTSQYTYYSIIIIIIIIIPRRRGWKIQFYGFTKNIDRKSKCQLWKSVFFPPVSVVIIYCIVSLIRRHSMYRVLIVLRK